MNKVEEQEIKKVMGDALYAECETTKRVKNMMHAYGAGFIIAGKWRYSSYLTYQEIREEIEFVMEIFQVMDIKPWMAGFSMLLKARFNRRIRMKGYMHKTGENWERREFPLQENLNGQIDNDSDSTNDI